MCGIYGHIGKGRFSGTGRIDDLLAHRGPDDHGSYESDELIFLHRRLSIQDTSPLGHQPMVSADGRFVLVYNGEIYNHKELRARLSGKYDFRSQSDSETVLYGFAEWGVSLFSKLNGIFALAILDREEGVVTIARDHLGVKPLYYYSGDGFFVFSSELKAVTATPGVPSRLCPEGVFNYLYYLWSPGSVTGIKGVLKLEPGNCLRIRSADASRISKERYFGISFGGYREIKDYKFWEKELEEKLLAAVERQMISDVPVGFFLSGGLDSSLIVAMYRHLYPDKPIRAFTVSAGKEFASEGFSDDLPYAKKVARHLLADLSISPLSTDMAADFDHMIWHLDEPQADLAPLLVENISRQARSEGCYVLLSGAGGDDLFSGYRRHQSVRLERLMRHFPFAGAMLDLLSSFAGEPGRRRIKKYTDAFRSGRGIEGLVNTYGWSAIGDLRSLFGTRLREMVSDYDPRRVLMDSLVDLPPDTDELNKMLFWDIRFFLPDHNLNYTDKLSMSQGVEVRVPFLDRELVEFSTRLPVEYKMQRGVTKYILRKLAEKYLPAEVINRSKTGFGAPVRHLIRNDLRGWVDQRLSRKNIVSQGVFDPDAVMNLIRRNREGKEDASYVILSLVAMESFIRQFNIETES